MPALTPNYADVASLVAGLVLPLIVALVTKKSTNSTVKGGLHALLSVATGFAAIYQSAPSHLQWAPAVVASFLAWLTGTTFYHSLLKKYGWVAALQNTLIKDAESAIHLPGGKGAFVEAFVQSVAEDLPVAQEEPVNDFPLSTDIVGAVQEVEQIPAVAQAVHAVEAFVAPAALPTAVLPAVMPVQVPTADTIPGAVQVPSVGQA